MFLYKLRIILLIIMMNIINLIFIVRLNSFLNKEFFLFRNVNRQAIYSAEPSVHVLPNYDIAPFYSLSAVSLRGV